MARKSNRLYPKRICQGCGELFTPHDNRQIFCCDQHRINFNNDQRKKRMQPVMEHKNKLTHNQTILKKIAGRKVSMPDLKVNRMLLEYEEFNFGNFQEKQINVRTGNEVFWSFEYGLEYDKESKLFLIHKREMSYDSNI